MRINDEDKRLGINGYGFIAVARQLGYREPVIERLRECKSFDEANRVMREARLKEIERSERIDQRADRPHRDGRK